MITKILHPVKCFVIILILLKTSLCYSQHVRPYYPNAHDTGGGEKPLLIKKNYIYYGFLSTLNQHISFEYNRWMSDEVMLVGSIGIINSGFAQETSNNSSVGGAFVEAGVKLMLNPDYKQNGTHNYFAEEGLYLKTQLVVSVFNTLVTNTTYSPYAYPPTTVTNQYSYTGVAVLMCLGAEWMIAHTLMFDIYAGFGVNTSGSTGSNPTYNYFSYLTAGTNFPLAFTGGVNIGLPFK